MKIYRQKLLYRPYVDLFFAFGHNNSVRLWMKRNVRELIMRISNYNFNLAGSSAAFQFLIKMAVDGIALKIPIFHHRWRFFGGLDSIIFDPFDEKSGDNQKKIPSQ